MQEKTYRKKTQLSLEQTKKYLKLEGRILTATFF